MNPIDPAPISAMRGFRHAGARFGAAVTAALLLATAAGQQVQFVPPAMGAGTPVTGKVVGATGAATDYKLGILVSSNNGATWWDKVSTGRSLDGYPIRSWGRADTCALPNPSKCCSACLSLCRTPCHPADCPHVAPSRMQTHGEPEARPRGTRESACHQERHRCTDIRCC